MNFSYSEEQLDVVNLARQILGDQTDPAQLAVIENTGHRFDDKLWTDLAKAGLLGLAAAEEQGGMGFGYETLCLLFEEVGRTVAPVPVVPVLVSALILQQCGDGTHTELLAQVASGKILISSALAEPGNEVRSPSVTTANQQDGNWSLTGVKTCVPLAEQSAQVLLTAQTPKGEGLFLVDPAGQGVTLERQQVTCGESQYLMSLTNAKGVQVSAQEVDITAWYDAHTVAYAAMAVGLCDRMMRMSASYTSEREQFGVPVATFQAVGHRMADCFVDIECLRLVTQEATSLIDQALPATEAALSAKIWTGDVTHRVSQASQHVHGGIGVDRDYPLFRFCLWARQLELTAGSSAELTACLGRNIAARYS